MSNVWIFLDLPSDLRQILAENSLTVDDLLRRKGIETNASHAALPAGERELERDKDLVPVIIAASTGVATILYAISRVLQTIYQRPHIFEWDELEEISNTDSSASSVLPRWRFVRKHLLLQPERERGSHELQLSAGLKGIVFRMKVQ